MVFALGQWASMGGEVYESFCVEVFLEHDGSHVRLVDVAGRLVGARFATGEYQHGGIEALAAHVDGAEQVTLRN